MRSLLVGIGLLVLCCCQTPGGGLCCGEMPMCGGLVIGCVCE